MSVSLPRQSEALYQTLTRMVEHYGSDAVVFLTLTNKQSLTVANLRKKVSKFHQLTKKVFPAIFSVIGVTPFATHIHCLAIIHKGSKLPRLKRQIKQLKAKAGFSQVFAVEHIRNAAAVCRYIAKNYSDTAAHFALPPKKKVGKTFMYRCLPKGCLVRGDHLTRNTPGARTYRATVTRLAQLAGTDVGDWKQLQTALCVREDRIRRIVFGLLQRVPCGADGLSSRVLLTAFPILRQFHSFDHLYSSMLASVCREARDGA